MKKLVVWTALILLSGSIVFPAGAAKKLYFAIATGEVGGTYHPLGRSLAAALSERIPGLVATAQTGNASVANSNLIARQTIESALIQNNVVNWAYTGTGLKEKRPREKSTSHRFPVPEAVQIVTTKTSGIRSLSDLRGKKVVVGTHGNGTAVDASLVLHAYGLKFSNLRSGPAPQGQTYRHGFRHNGNPYGEHHSVDLPNGRDHPSHHRPRSGPTPPVCVFLRSRKDPTWTYSRYG